MLGRAALARSNPRIPEALSDHAQPLRSVSMRTCDTSLVPMDGRRTWVLLVPKVASRIIFFWNANNSYSMDWERCLDYTRSGIEKQMSAHLSKREGERENSSYSSCICYVKPATFRSLSHVCVSILSEYPCKRCMPHSRYSEAPLDFP